MADKERDRGKDSTSVPERGGASGWREAVFEKTGRAGEHPSMSLVSRDAFVLTPASLQAFEKLSKDFVSRDANGDMTTKVQILSEGEIREFEAVAPLADLRNPKSDAISAVFVSARSGERVAHVWFDNNGIYKRAAAVLRAESPSTIELGQFETAAQRELSNVRPWYAPIRRVGDTCAYAIGEASSLLGAVFAIVVFTVAILWLLGVVVMFVSHATSSSGSQDVGPAVHSSPDTETLPTAPARRPSPGTPEAPTRPPSKPVAWRDFVPFLYTLAAACVGVMLVLAARFVWTLVPRVVFEIGEGVRRHENQARLRRFVIGSIIICGVGLPLLRKVLFD